MKTAPQTLPLMTPLHWWGWSLFMILDVALMVAWVIDAGVGID